MNRGMGVEKRRGFVVRGRGRDGWFLVTTEEDFSLESLHGVSERGKYGCSRSGLELGKSEPE